MQPRMATNSSLFESAVHNETDELLGELLNWAPRKAVLVRLYNLRYGV